MDVDNGFYMAKINTDECIKGAILAISNSSVDFVSPTINIHCMLVWIRFSHLS